MIKTEQEIERDFYRIVCEGDIGRTIRGTVYRSEMRPNDASTEDIVISFLTGLDAQDQTGIVVVNVYVPDIDGPGGRLVADRKRIGELEELMLELTGVHKEHDYRIETERTPYSRKADIKGQHVVVCRYQFTHYSED